MNRLILLLPFFLLVSVQLFGQIRHVRGIKSIEVAFIKSKFGTGAAASYVKYFSNSVYGKVSGFLEQGSDSGLSYRSVGIDFAAARNIVHGGHKTYLNALGGCTFSIDGITRGGENLDISSEFKTGAFIGLENEFFLQIASCSF